jgi:hypothetical protein
MGSSSVAALAGGAAVFDAELMVAGGHRIAVSGAGHSKGYWPKRGCYGVRVVQCVQSVPGQDEVPPVGLGRWGGALG